MRHSEIRWDRKLPCMLNGMGWQAKNFIIFSDFRFTGYTYFVWCLRTWFARNLIWFSKCFILLALIQRGHDTAKRIFPNFNPLKYEMCSVYVD